MSFIEVQFPTDISFGSDGGPEFMTDVVVIGSGHEQRNSLFPIGRHRFNVAYGAKIQEQTEALINFFQAMRGRKHGFRYQDPLDYKSCSILDTPAYGDQSIGTGDGAETQFQLIKQYTEGSLTLDRTINKPVSGTTLVGVNGANQAAGWSVETTTGLITFDVAPTDGHAITAGYEFDVPVRFDTDRLQIGVNNKSPGLGYVVDTDIPVIEIIAAWATVISTSPASSTWAAVQATIE